ncbi:MAG: DUF1844 domain-containing protein [Planctomycetota bacterium]|nr:DUF1844 domain-containing protein [Planctomycetota bacterium]
MAEDQQPKIIIDDDWKAQAQAEKAKLAEKEREKAAGAPAGTSGEAPAAGAVPGQQEKIGISDLVQMLASQALMYMGAVADPQTGKAVVSPPMAQAHIELLGVLEEKTKGNLTDDESKMISGITHELRMQFVELTKAIEQAVKEGKITMGPDGEMRAVSPPAGAPGMPPIPGQPG